MLVFLRYSLHILLVAKPCLGVISATESLSRTRVNVFGWVSNINENILNTLKSGEQEVRF